MITRLKIDGFKNLVNVDVHLDSFVCIAGANAVGKSNLFDAIRFLSALAEHRIMDAAKSVRSETQKASDIRDIFSKINDHYSETISFEIEMIIPAFADDESGELAESSITTVKYELKLRYLKDDDDERIIIEKEVLKPISLRDARRNIYFSDKEKWKKSVIRGRRTSEFISTSDSEGGKHTIRLHQDQTKGNPIHRVASQLPRTVLSTATAEHPTACVVKQEMKSWMLLQLEPSAMRKSDDFDKRKTARLGADGANLPATIYRLHVENPNLDIYQKLSNRLSELIDNVETVNIDKDDKRALLTLFLKFKGSTELPARSLSDGTLRFLALAILELDYQSGGIICLEEPENGIHPKKIKAMIQLLQDIACDTHLEINTDNPFRQVIINTHSPLVVQQVPEESLLVAGTEEQYDKKLKMKHEVVVFDHLSNTWRDKIPGTPKMIAMGDLLAYLGGVTENSTDNAAKHSILSPKTEKKTVAERDDIKNLASQLSLFQ